MTAQRFPLRTGQQGAGTVRLAVDRMADMGLVAGDIVRLTGTRQTHARVLPAARGTDVLEAGDMTFHNLAADTDQDIEVLPVSLPPLKSAVIRTLAPYPGKPQDLQDSLSDLPLTLGDRFTLPLPGNPRAEVEVMAIDPAPAGLFCDETTLSLVAHPSPASGYDGIGGLADQIARVHEMVAVPLLRPDLFDRLGVPAPRGVLFTGPPGSGKTLLARSIAARTSAAFFQISGPEIVSKHYGESEAALRNIFGAAAKDAPAIVFIDEIDAIAPRRDVLSGEKQVERRIVAQLLTLLDGLAERGRIIVMAATNLPDSLDPALRRPGRFDREINFGPPDATARLEILRIHLRDAPLAPDVDLDAIAQASHGYVGADLAALAREASLAALERTVSEAGGESAVRADALFLTQADLRHGLGATRPSNLRDTVVETPRIGFDDIGGMETAKAALREAVLWPIEQGPLFEALRIDTASGILLAGPPGSGKTLLARAIASESDMNFIPVRASRIMSQYLGDAERAIAELFVKARQSAPAILFFDELDALAPRRTGKDPVLDRIVAQLLTDMDGMTRNRNVVVLAATNRADAIDPALTRPGRFDTVIAIGLPDEAARHDILRVHCRNRPMAEDVDLAAWAAKLQGYSGADLATLVTAAARNALRRHLGSNTAPLQIAARDFDHARAEIDQSNRARVSDHIRKGKANAPA